MSLNNPFKISVSVKSIQVNLKCYSLKLRHVVSHKLPVVPL